MIHKQQFGILPKETLLKTFSYNDWTHCMLARKQKNDVVDLPKSYKSLATVLISAQFSIAFGLLIWCNFMQQQSMFLTCSAIWAFVISVMNMSNATKNQTDSFSRIMQSYWTKIHSAFFYCSLSIFYEMEYNTTMFMAALSLVMLIDACTGLYILYQLFSTSNKNITITEQFLGDEQKDQKINKPYNSRIPIILKSNQLMEKLFTTGWKFDLFNQQGFINKQIAAIAVIFGLMQFSIVNLLLNDNLLFSLAVLGYSLVCLETFLNLTYIRDFDALQVNATPILLAFTGAALLINDGFSYALLGTTAFLIADSFFALRYQPKSDTIQSTPLELFSMQSWTQGAFEKTENFTLQITATAFIFFQIFLSLAGSAQGDRLCILIAIFYMLRLMQFIFNSVLGLQMAQSNMACVLLALYGFLSLGSGLFSGISTLLMVVDAYIGFYLFVTERHGDVSEYFACFKKTIYRPMAQNTADTDGNMDNAFVKI